MFLQLKKVLCLVFLSSMALSTSAIAKGVGSTGAYLGLKAGLNILDFDNKNLPNFDESISYGVYAGYKFFPQFGLEISYADSGSYEEDIQPDISQRTAGLGFSMWGDAGENGEAFAKLMAVFVESEFDQNSSSSTLDEKDTGFSYEIGYAYHFTKMIAVTGSIAYMDFDTFEINSSTKQANLGILFNF